MILKLSVDSESCSAICTKMLSSEWSYCICSVLTTLSVLYDSVVKAKLSITISKTNAPAMPINDIITEINNTIASFEYYPFIMVLKLEKDFLVLSGSWKVDVFLKVTI